MLGILVLYICDDPFIQELEARCKIISAGVLPAGVRFKRISSLRRRWDGQGFFKDLICVVDELGVRMPDEDHAHIHERHHEQLRLLLHRRSPFFVDHRR